MPKIDLTSHVIASSLEVIEKSRQLLAQTEHLAKPFGPAALDGETNHLEAQPHDNGSDELPV